MGQTYNIYLKLHVKDEEGLKKALADKIARGEQEHTEYNLDHYKEKGVDTNTLNGLLQVIYGGWDARLHESPKGEFEADFSCSYGWQAVMEDAFDEMAPFLEDGSYLKIYPDEGSSTIILEGGKVNYDYKETDYD